MNKTAVCSGCPQATDLPIYLQSVGSGRRLARPRHGLSADVALLDMAMSGARIGITGHVMRDGGNGALTARAASSLCRQRRLSLG